MTDHVCSIKLSGDGGHNWGATSQHDIGATGEFVVAAIRRRCGQYRTLMLECSVSSPFKAPVMAMAAMTEREV